ncbi:PaaI family thioesterase [Halalkalibacter sp. APA_J-10(15)]|uniref:PaaI family thioesterase n=1 Tax=Halalkalibacter sp. APA_J-10(15) TaxID=2933805 RepID=UPI001FF50C65|nr:PaaI family thioesterase [Halalkalibacter sp. APA_J-10(15)]MCK0470391.1 PaaI family thioesterase [Halalkalibacter sp. APA_J-10(15)]
MENKIKLNANKEISVPPVAKLIGFNLVEVKNGKSVFTLKTKETHFNPMGTVHGGILCDLADAEMGVAYATLLDERETYTTIELKINYLKPVWKTTLKANAIVVKKGSSIGLIECTIFDENETLVAKASSTCMTLNGEKAINR